MKHIQPHINALVFKAQLLSFSELCKLKQSTTCFFLTQRPHGLHNKSCDSKNPLSLQPCLFQFYETLNRSSLSSVTKANTGSFNYRHNFTLYLQLIHSYNQPSLLILTATLNSWFNVSTIFYILLTLHFFTLSPCHDFQDQSTIELHIDIFNKESS